MIGRENLPINDSTRVCSRHFINSKGRKLRPSEIPSVNLPSLAICVVVSSPRRPLIGYDKEFSNDTQAQECHNVDPQSYNKTSEIAVNTDLTMTDIDELETQLKNAKEDLQKSELQLESI